MKSREFDVFRCLNTVHLDLSLRNDRSIQFYRVTLHFHTTKVEKFPMFRRSVAINVPIEVVRSIVVIAQTGSFTKAAEKMGLTQPAISAQLKRVQALVGGPVFERSASGAKLTPRGALILQHAQR